MWQLADEAHRIADEEGQVAEHDFPHRSVQRCEELVLREHGALAQYVHQRALAHVSVAHQRHAHHLATVATLHGLLFIDVLQLLLQQRNAIAHDAAVGLDLFLATATARAGAAALALQVRPQFGETW